ncbi:MAG: type II secretion system protein [Pseudomonadota bacterium]
MRSAKGDQRGFTLLELLFVLGIVAVVLVLASARIRPSVGAELSIVEASESLALNLARARNASVRQGVITSYSLDIEDRSFYGLNDSVSHRYRPEIDVRARVARDDQVIRGVATFRFWPDGSSTGGEVVFENDGVRYVVRVDWLTGAVAVARGESEVS